VRIGGPNGTHGTEVETKPQVTALRRSRETGGNRLLIRRFWVPNPRGRTTKVLGELRRVDRTRRPSHLDELGRAWRGARVCRRSDDDDPPNGGA